LTDLEKKAENEIRNYLRILKDSGYETTHPQKGSYCFETVISRNSEKVKLLVYYGKKGVRSVLQGNQDAGFYSEIKQLLFNELPLQQQDFREPERYIGTDESGKGDFFGPLVIAGVLVDAAKKKELDRIGVRDSKLVAHSSIKKLSNDIKRISGRECFNIVVINPPRYNELYEKFGNLNKLLAWGHAKVLENILAGKDASMAISDKFGDENLIINALQEKGKNLDLNQFHKAEKYTAVAAASILARDRFNDWFGIKKKELNTELPKGAGEKVTETAKLIRSEYGDEFLQQLTKTHFKISRKL
jgi:ribonuclease HIII